MRILRLITGCLVLTFFAGCGAETTAAPELAIGASGGGEGGARLATGSGHVPQGSGLREFTFHAKGTGEGGIARGSYKVELTSSGLFFEVEVSCMAVEGNTAWIAGHISDTNASVIQVGSVSYFYAIDNGEGAGAPADVVSTARINDIDGEDQVFCNERPLLLASFAIDQGNVQIR